VNLLQLATLKLSQVETLLIARCLELSRYLRVCTPAELEILLDDAMIALATTRICCEERTWS
jgi:hypothetical protein